MNFNLLESTNCNLILLLRNFLNHHPKIINLIFGSQNEKLAHPIEKIIAETGTFSSGEQLLIKIVLHLWTQDQPNINLWLILKQLDHRNFKKFIQLIIDLRYKI